MSSEVRQASMSRSATAMKVLMPDPPAACTCCRCACDARHRAAGTGRSVPGSQSQLPQLTDVIHAHFSAPVRTEERTDGAGKVTSIIGLQIKQSGFYQSGFMGTPTPRGGRFSAGRHHGHDPASAAQDRTSGLRQRLHAGRSLCGLCVSWASGYDVAKFLILRRIAPGLCGLIRFSSVSWSLIQNYARRRGSIIFIEFY